MIFKMKPKDMEVVLEGIVSEGQTVVLSTDKQLTQENYNNLTQSMQKTTNRGVDILIIAPPFKVTLIPGRVN